ncbi:TMEM175 family protein [Pinirhizobacter sp.]|jgi:uncharacterized membrane protein|uniref:TMEM175 family protein n=1 Tax=Pinirhizobacter sp. TaxID=2950432 RepID=UPI002F41CA38
MSPTPSLVPEEHIRQRHLDRLVMMSDGVFAIALTLSAVELRPEFQAGKSFFDIWALPLGVYFMSFLLIAAVWMAHRRNLAHMSDVDGPATWLNLLLLSLVGLLPVVVRYFLTNVDNTTHSGTVAYGAVLAATYASLGLAWGYSSLVAGLAPTLSRRRCLSWLAEYLFVAVVFLALVLYTLGFTWVAIPVAAIGIGLRLLSVSLGRGEAPIKA